MTCTTVKTIKKENRKLPVVSNWCRDKYKACNWHLRSGFDLLLWPHLCTLTPAVLVLLPLTQGEETQIVYVIPSAQNTPPSLLYLVKCSYSSSLYQKKPFQTSLIQISLYSFLQHLVSPVMLARIKTLTFMSLSVSLTCEFFATIMG